MMKSEALATEFFFHFYSVLNLLKIYRTVHCVYVFAYTADMLLRYLMTFVLQGLQYFSWTRQ